MISLKEESGFTLMELLVVLAILSIFIISISSILMMSMKIINDTKNLNGHKNASTTAFAYIEKTIRQNDAKAAVSTMNHPVYGTMLKVKVNTGSNYLFYYYDNTTQKLFCQYSTTFDPSNEEQTLEIANGITSGSFHLNSSKQTLSLQMDVILDEDGTNESVNKVIVLKAN